MPITKAQRDKIKEIFTGTPVTRIEVTFQGAGDSGDINSPEYYNSAGAVYVERIDNRWHNQKGGIVAVPGLDTLFNHVELPITITTSRKRHKYEFTATGSKLTEYIETDENTFKTVNEFIEDMVHTEAMDSGYDWYNNEGGGGSWELDLTTGERKFNMYIYPEPEAETVVNELNKWAQCKTARKERKRAGAKAA